MHPITEILSFIDQGDPHAAEHLLPLVYEELRALAALKMAREAPTHTLQPTALVHEAYLRLVGDHAHWNSRGHFFAAAAEAMRRILVESARRKGRVCHGGGRQRIERQADPAVLPPDEDVIALDEALERLAQRDPVRAELVKLRYFAELTMPEVAAVLGISLATAERYWTFARTWLYAELSEEPADG